MTTSNTIKRLTDTLTILNAQAKSIVYKSPVAILCNNKSYYFYQGKEITKNTYNKLMKLKAFL